MGRGRIDRVFSLRDSAERSVGFVSEAIPAENCSPAALSCRFCRGGGPGRPRAIGLGGEAIFGPYRTGLRRRRSLAVPYTGSCSAGLPATGAEPISGFERTAVPICFRCAPCGTHVYTIRTRTRIRCFSSGDGADSAYAPELARMKSESVIFFRVAGVPIRSTCVSIINGSRPSTSRSRKISISARFRSIGSTAIS